MVDQRLPELAAVITPARTDIVGVRQSGDTRDKKETIAQALSLIIAADIATPLKSIAAGSAAAPSVAWGDGDTGFYELADGIINFTAQGAGVWSFRTGAILPFNAAGPAMLNEAATSINPTFAPNASDLDTGLGWNAIDQLSLIAGGKEIARATEAAALLQLAIAPSGSSAVPELTGIGDEDTGLRWAGSNQLDVITAGSQSWHFSSAQFFSSPSDGPAMANDFGDITKAGFLPQQGDTDTGLGGDGNDSVSLVAGGIAGLRLKELNSGVVQAPVADVAITAFATGGQGSAVALKQSYNVLATVATAGDSVKLPATFNVNSIVYIKNDGAESADVFPASGDDLGAGANTAVAVAAGTSAVFIATAASATWTQLIQFASGGADPSLLGDGTVGAPSYSFTNSPTTGLYRQGADSLGIATAGVARFEFNGDVLRSENSSGPAMVNAAINAILPQFCPNQNDLNTGLGSPGQDEISLIAGGVEGVRYVEGSGVRMLASYQFDDTLTAFAGGGQGSATLLGSSYNEFTVVATAGDSAKLMVGHPKGTKVFVKNNGTNSMDIFPAVGDQIDTLGLNNAVSLPAGKSILFMTTTGNDTWTVMDFGIIPDPLLLGDGTKTNPTYSFSDDPDTGMYTSFDGVLAFAAAGVEAWKMTGDLLAGFVGNGPQMRNRAATETIPTLIPHTGDPTTGIGANAATPTNLSLIASGFEGIRIINTAGVDSVVIHPGVVINDPATPSLAFGDGDTGFFEFFDDRLALALGGVNFILFDGSTTQMTVIGDIVSNDANGYALENEAASATNPTIRPRKIDVDSGFGSSAADAISVITGGLEALRFTELNSGVVQAPAADVTITAFATGGQGSAVTLKQSYNVISVCATAGDSVKLPPVYAVGSIVHVKNDGADSCDVFPATNDDLGAGNNTALAVASGSSVSFIATTANDVWTQLIKLSA